MKNAITNLWDYRNLTIKLATSDFKLRYKNSILGFFWSLIEPLLMLTVLYFIFSYLMKINVEHYQLFLLVGIISWNMLARGTTMSLGSILGKPSLVNKVYFPREILVVSSCITALLMTLLEFVIFGIFMIIFAVTPTITAIYFPFILSIEFILILGLSFGLASMNVYYRDIQYIWAVIIQVGFFASPIIYPISIIPEKYVWIIKLNPMTIIIDTLRRIMIDSATPILKDIIFVTMLSFVILIIGYMIFLKLEPKFAEEI
jgi:lipopolysaccharide transport system permease protein